MKQTAKHQNGFTLIELLVSVFILTMLTAIVIANFRIGEKSKRASAAKDIVLNAVRNAQNFTLTSRQISSSSCAPGGVPDKSPIGYRVLFVTSSNTAVLYAQDKCLALHVVETYTLPFGAQYVANGIGVTTTSGTTSYGTVQIKFDAPFAPSAYATAAGASPAFNVFQSAVINITDDAGNNARTVTVDGVSGRIE